MKKYARDIKKIYQQRIGKDFRDRQILLNEIAINAEMETIKEEIDVSSVFMTSKKTIKKKYKMLLNKAVEDHCLKLSELSKRLLPLKILFVLMWIGTLLTFSPIMLFVTVFYSYIYIKNVKYIKSEIKFIPSIQKDITRELKEFTQGVTLSDNGVYVISSFHLNELDCYCYPYGYPTSEVDGLLSQAFPPGA